jgi:hypothetical protein
MAFLCLLAAVRVFAFCAAFPFFNNVDEEAHFDLIAKLASGHVPTELEPFDARTADLIAAVRSPEYYQGMWGAEVFSRKASQPEYWQAARNHEATSPPVYYVVAAAWYKAGQVLGLSGRTSLYWIRFLNIPVFAALVWIAYCVARAAFPGSWHLRLGLPSIVAFWPQDVFYSINSDVLSAPLVGLALVGLSSIGLKRAWGFRRYVGTGLLLAASFLTKLTNIPVLAVAVAVALGKLRHSDSRTKDVHRTLAMAAAVLIPVGLWCMWNLVAVGDLLGVKPKSEQMGFTVKPFGAIWYHPIFTLKGLNIFWHDLMGTLWRGEFFWHGSRLASPGADAVYAIASAVFVLVGAITLLRPVPYHDESQTIAMRRICLMAVLLYLGMLVVLSIVFDFGTSPFPSRAYPYFAIGRLMSGAFIPLAVICLLGLDHVLTPVKEGWIRFAFVLIIPVIATTSEIHLSWNVFRSQYNWFHG